MKNSLLAFALAVVMTVLVNRPDGAAQDPAPTGKIAFSKFESTARVRLCVINVDGTGQHEVATSTAMNMYPAWSPLVANGVRKLAYSGSDNPQAPQTCLINEDGTEEQRVTSGAEFHAIPAWSPDGTQILCSSPRSLRIVNLDGTVAREFPNPEGIAFLFGFWAPPAADGKGRQRIGYTRVLDLSAGAIHLSRADGTGDEALITGGLNFCGHGAWSPDGKTLAFFRLDSAIGSGSLWLFDMVTKGETLLCEALTTPPMGPIAPTACWSPDGKCMVASIFDKAGKGRLYLLSRDGQMRKALTSAGDSCFGPSWTK